MSERSHPRRPALGYVLGAVAGFLVGAACAIAWYGSGAEETGPAAAAARVPAPLETAPPVERPPRDERDLADIAAIADDFERNAALYALAQNADRTDTENLLAQTRELPPSPQRNDITRLLYVRLASIDSEAAADHVLGWSYQPSWLATVFRVWAHADFDAAVERAGSLEARQQHSIASSLLEMDLAPWQRQLIADRLDAESLLAQVLAREEMAFGTPEQTWARALQAPPGEERNQLLQMAAKAWTRSNPQAALEAALDLAHDDDQWLAYSILRDWAQAEAAGALDWLSRQGRTPRTEHLPSAVAGAIAELDVEAALRALESVPAWARHSAQSGIFRRWLEKDLTAAMEWFGSLPIADQQQHRFEATREYARRDPQGALNWAMASDRRIREQLIGSVISSIDDSAEAERLFRGIEDPDLQAEVALWLSRHAPEDPQDALRWADTFDREVRDRLRSNILRDWAQSDPEGVLQEVARQRTPLDRNQATEDAISGLLRAFHIDAAERLFETISSTRVRCSAAWDLHFYFRQTEPNAAKAAAYRVIAQSCVRGGQGGESASVTRQPSVATKSVGSTGRSDRQQNDQDGEVGQHEEQRPKAKDDKHEPSGQPEPAPAIDTAHRNSEIRQRRESRHTEDRLRRCPLHQQRRCGNHDQERREVASERQVFLQVSRPIHGFQQQHHDERAKEVQDRKDQVHPSTEALLYVRIVEVADPGQRRHGGPVLGAPCGRQVVEFEDTEQVHHGDDDGARHDIEPDRRRIAPLPAGRVLERQRPRREEQPRHGSEQANIELQRLAERASKPIAEGTQRRALRGAAIRTEPAADRSAAFQARSRRSRHARLA